METDGPVITLKPLSKGRRGKLPLPTGYLRAVQGSPGFVKATARHYDTLSKDDTQLPVERVPPAKRRSRTAYLVPSPADTSPPSVPRIIDPEDDDDDLDGIVRESPSLTPPEGDEAVPPPSPGEGPEVILVTARPSGGCIPPPNLDSVETEGSLVTSRRVAVSIEVENIRLPERCEGRRSHGETVDPPAERRWVDELPPPPVHATRKNDAPTIRLPSPDSPDSFIVMPSSAVVDTPPPEEETQSSKAKEAGCTVCLEAFQITALSECTECKEVLCDECWRNEHQNKKRRWHQKQGLRPSVPPPADNTTALSPVRSSSSRESSSGSNRSGSSASAADLPPSQYLQEVLDELNSERIKRATVEARLMKKMEDEKRLRDEVEKERKAWRARDAGLQQHLQTTTLHAREQEMSHQKREQRLQQMLQQATATATEARRQHELIEANLKLQLSSANLRADRATATIETLRGNLNAQRHEADRAKFHVSQLKHQLEQYRVQSTNWEIERNHLRQQVHQLQRAAQQRSTPPSERKATPEEFQSALREIMKRGIEEVGDEVVAVISGSMSSVRSTEAWAIIGLPFGAAGAADKAKKLMSKLHPDRVAIPACKETLRKRFQLVNHARALLPTS